MTYRTFEAALKRFPNIHTLVVGDLMIDEYLWGNAERISPEAPVPVVDVLREDTRLGGAGNVLHNLAALGVPSAVVGVVGNDDNGTVLRNMIAALGVDISGIAVQNGRRTSRKTRVMAAHQQMVRIDRESREPIEASAVDLLLRWVTAHISRFQVVILSDYGKGLLTQELTQGIIQQARLAGVPIFVDPKGNDYSLYRGATTITPNRKEASLASGIAIHSPQTLQQAGEKLLHELDLEVMTITRSEEGMSLFFPGGAVEHIPTMAREVFDVSGAGDTVISVMAVAHACGLPFVDCARLANAAAGVVVGKLGTSVATPEEILENLRWEQNHLGAKIKDLDALVPIVERLKQSGKKIVFTNGCFDILHYGHITYLQDARNQGDLLILGLNSDASIRRLKGESRPIIGQDERAHVLAALECIDYVVIFDEDTPLRLIEAIQPYRLAKGGDYTPDKVVGREVVEAHGGEVVIIPFVEGKSTTGIIERILANRHES
ncbi:bifunctional D-glycero-beta-D-manno-heptose-7-phosphate kinase/D-glycero-beta-D-manno-heptose 1-phosphate adenylyltransferase HldE [Chrysiogenes arsenatis]|uniref:bifunctional D-glycero-beta-D-manno-heptose-7-phosphate kinase/D-glycero-beta-D-manno-heptose 1-phosphate adenylyltransferase HldE n=1 Tax=Chrysiogenes arsenatis TaxID=309797 RepID=UPI0004195C22|nr:bifunctional D-glycero-beta-D-manno-heptose-7-phosphate kinase/D-glycero-beta-D-manno-heptose 1-phosphate adenylyltransferase HldE [Chrysiogenes arsenatis]